MVRWVLSVWRMQVLTALALNVHNKNKLTHMFVLALCEGLNFTVLVGCGCVVFLCGVCMFTLCLHRFPPGMLGLAPAPLWCSTRSAGIPTTWIFWLHTYLLNNSIYDAERERVHLKKKRLLKLTLIGLNVQICFNTYHVCCTFTI